MNEVRFWRSNHEMLDQRLSVDWAQTWMIPVQSEHPAGSVLLGHCEPL